MILQQAADGLTSGIVSGIFRSATHDVIAQSAQFLPDFLYYDIVIDLIPARPQCAVRHCEVIIDNIPLAPGAQGHVGPFGSVVLDVFSLEDDLDDFSSFMAAGSRLRSRTTEMPVHTMKTAARQHEDEDPDDADSSDTSEVSDENPEPDAAWRPTAIFSVHQPPHHGILNWANPELRDQQVARLLQFERALVQCHRMPWPPADLTAAGEAGLLVQHRDDLPDGSRYRLVLVDTEFHPRPPSWEVETVPSPIYMPEYVTRGMILRAMDLGVYCQYVQDKCIVWHNEETFTILQRRLSLHLRHGDHIRVAVPPPEDDMTHVPTRCVAHLFQMGVSCHSVAEVNSSEYGSDPGNYEATMDDADSSELLQQHSVSELRPQKRHEQSDTSAIIKEMQTCTTLLMIRCLRVEVPWVLANFLLLKKLSFLDGIGFCNVGPRCIGECGQGLGVVYGPLALSSLSRTSRSTPLWWCHWKAFLDSTSMARTDWYSGGVALFIVNPPPEEPGQDILAHILLVQHPRPDSRSILMTSHDLQFHQDVRRTFAIMVPGQVFRQLIIDMMGYSQHCHHGHVRCRVSDGRQELTDDAPFPLQHGMGLYFEARLWTVDVWQDAALEDEEHVNLLQTRARGTPLCLASLCPHSAGTQARPQVTAVRLCATVDFIHLPDYVEILGNRRSNVYCSLASAIGAHLFDDATCAMWSRQATVETRPGWIQGLLLPIYTRGYSPSN